MKVAPIVEQEYPENESSSQLHSLSSFNNDFFE